MARIGSWEDWFRLCGDMADAAREYEDAAERYCASCEDVSTAKGRRRADERAKGRLKSSFWERDPKVFDWERRIAIIHGVVGLAIGIIVVWIVLAIASYVVSATSGRPASLPGILWPIVGGLAFGLCWALVPLGSSMLLRKRMAHKMEDLEDGELADISVVPPRYRNSFSLDMLYQLYRECNILSVSVAIDKCSAYEESNPGSFPGGAIMFDVPYTSQESQGEPERHSREDAEATREQSKKNPNLPPDIESKTHVGTENPDAALDALVGLEGVKQQVRSMRNRISFYGESSTSGMSGNNMIFLGSAGTGKTTVARIVTRIFYDFGYIRENRCVEIDGAYLKGQFVGQTGERTSAIIDWAMGGVLFIDEAYMMRDDTNSGGFGSEATGVLLKAMEDRRDDFIVILAGYEDDINRLIASNEGFASRVKHKLYFDDFSVDELLEIADGMLVSQMGTDWSMDAAARDLFGQELARERRMPGFGNARVVRNALDILLDIHADNCYSGENDKTQTRVITEADMRTYVERRERQVMQDLRNQMAARGLDESIVSFAELRQHTHDAQGSVADLVGMAEVKQAMEDMRRERAFLGEGSQVRSGHWAMLGLAAADVADVAGALAADLYEVGAIRDRRYIRVTGDFLRGMYLGQTGKRVEATMAFAQGMLVVIEAADMLVADGTDQFGAEAVGVISERMVSLGDDTVVMLAGTQGGMDRLLASYPGLAQSIRRIVRCGEYTAHETCQLIRRMARERGFEVDRRAWVPLQRMLGGGGDRERAMSITEAAVRHHIDAWDDSGDDASKMTLTADDFRAGLPALAAGVAAS